MEKRKRKNFKNIFLKIIKVYDLIIKYELHVWNEEKIYKIEI